MAARNRYTQKNVNDINRVLQEIKCNEIASDKITTNIKWILAYTTSANDVKIIHHSDGINVLLDTLYRHSLKDVDIVRLTLIAIGNCLKYPSELPRVIGKEESRWEELCEYLVKTLKVADVSQLISTHCLRILEKLAKNERLRENIYKLVDGFLLLLRRLTSTTLRHDETLYLMDLIAELLYLKNCKITFVNQNGLLTVTKKMASTKDEEIFRRCIEIISVIAMNRDRLHYCQRLKDDGCFRTIVFVGMDKKKSSKIRKRAVNLLFDLCNINSYSRLLVLANIHTLLLRLIETAPMGHTKSCAIRSLSSLCCDVANRSTLNKCGAIEKLILLLRDEDVKKLHHKIVDGLHWFLHDQEALRTMIQKYDLIIALAGYLDKLVDGLENSVNFENIGSDNYNDGAANFERTRFHPVLSSSNLASPMDSYGWTSSCLSPVSFASGSSTSSTPIHSSDMSTSENIMDSYNDNISDRHGIAMILNLLKSTCRLSHLHHVNVVRFCMKGLLGCIVKDSENRVDAYKVILLIVQNKCCLKIILHHCIPWLIYQFLMTDREIKLSSHTFIVFAKYFLHDESLEEHWNISKNDKEDTLSGSEHLSLLEGNNIEISSPTEITDFYSVNDQSITSSSLPQEIAVSLLRCIGNTSSSDYGKGEIKNILSTGNVSCKRACAFSLPYLMSYERSMYKVLINYNGISTIMEPLLHDNVDNFMIIITCNCISSLIERFQPCGFIYERKRPHNDDDDNEGQHLTAKVPKLKHSQDTDCLNYSSINGIDNCNSDYCGQWPFMPADVIFVTESGIEFPVNHTIVSQQSIYFSAMYDGYFSESKLGKSYFKDVDDEAMIAMLLYLYGFNWRKNVSIKEFKAVLCAKSDREVSHAVKMLTALNEKTDIEFYWNILIVADRFLLNELKDACESYITLLLKSHHMSNALLLSCIYCCKGLFTHCVDFFFRRATSIEQCDCFKLFPAPYKEDFIKGVSNYLNEISDNNI